MEKLKLKDLLDSTSSQLKGLSSLDNPDFRLEQAVFNHDEKFWEIIVSYLVEDHNKPVTPMKPFTPQYPFHRVYKKVILDESGQVSEFQMYGSEI